MRACVCVCVCVCQVSGVRCQVSGLKLRVNGEECHVLYQCTMYIMCESLH